MEEKCRNIDASGRSALASIRNVAEKNHVSSILKGRRGWVVDWVWIGGVKIADGPFFWYKAEKDGAVTVSKLGAKFWKRHEPNGGRSGENCMQTTSDGEWVDYVCNDQVAALCEMRC